MKKIILAVAMALGLSFGVVAADVAPVSAGSSCYPPTVSRGGAGNNYWTYSSYGTGNGYHRVAVVKNGYWQYGPWKYGSGYSTITVYYGTSGGVSTCFVL